MALRAQASGFEPHRAAARANVPHAAVGTQLHAGQRHGAHLLLGDEASISQSFGLALVVGAVSQAHAHGLRAHLAAHQHHHVGVGKGLLRGVVR